MDTNIYAIFFSPTGNTELVTRAIAGGLAKVLTDKDYYAINITPSFNREGALEFGKGDIVVVGLPTYAGRVPNKLEPFVAEAVFGDDAIVIPVVTYGNRAYDDSLYELATLLWDNGMNIAGYAAVPCEHAFSSDINSGRPDKDDINVLFEYGMQLGEAYKQGKLKNILPYDIDRLHKDELKYYIPLKENHEPAKFLKAMPKTDEKKCTGCGTCKEVCPMNCFDNSVVLPEGVCIKCMACVKACETSAKYFDDSDFESHVEMLRKEYADIVNKIELG